MEERSSFGRRNHAVGVRFGFGSYTGSNVVLKSCDIGRCCSISWNLSIGGMNHDYESASTCTSYWWKSVLGVDSETRTSVLRTTVGNDVWIGCGANVLSGVVIGDGAVIGAGALVNKDIPPYAIAVGVPARVIKYRFDKKTVARLLEVAWWDWPPAVLRTMVKELTGKLDEKKLVKMEDMSEIIRKSGGRLA